MSDELLRRAANALREETREADDGARFTRARVMASLQQSEHRRRTRLALLLPFAACFAAATAWGTMSGRAAAWVSRVGEALGIEVKPPPAASQQPASQRAAKPRPAPTHSSAPIAPPLEAPPLEAPPSPSAAEPPVAPSVPQRPAPDAPVASSRVAPRRDQGRKEAPSPAPSAPSDTHSDEPPAALRDISDRAHELYRAAHRSHFVEHDYASALRAWDAYLTEAPGGRFALEAQYNRALCLVRLGRNDDARAALAPFAAGKFGAYRQNEAKALLDALSR